MDTCRPIVANAIVATDERRVAFRDVTIGAVEESDILVELECSAISVGTESYVLGDADRFPRSYIPGYAPIGRVTWVGSQAASRFAVGDRVSYFAPRPPDPSAGVTQNCGGHQSPAILTIPPEGGDLLGSNSYCVKVPEQLSSERAAFGGICSISCLGISLAKPSVGDRALVIGQGMIGQFAAQHLKLRGAEVAVADLHSKRLRLSARSGVDHLINASEQNLVDALHTIWPSGADIIVDSTGSYRVVEASIPAIRTRGKYVFLGWYKGADFNLETLHGRVFEAYFPWTLEGARVLSCWRLMNTGALQVDHLITHRFPAEEAQKAYDLIYTVPEQYAGIMLDWRK